MFEKKRFVLSWFQQHPCMTDILLAFLVGVLLTVHSYSFLSLFLPPMQSWDSQIYYMIGKMWGEGSGLPYRDLFDHKGPLLYFINCCAYWVGGTKGIVLFEFIAFFLTVWILEKSFAFISVPAGRAALLFFPLIYKLIIVITPFQAGNFPEQYALVFLAFGIYCTTKLHYTGKLCCTEIMGLGISIGCCLLLKANMIFLFPVPVCLLIFSHYRFRSGWLKHILLIVCGMGVVLIPFLLYFWSKGILYDCYYANILYNIEYAKRGGPLSVFYRFYLMVGRLIWYKINILPVILLGAFVFIAALKKEKSDLQYGTELLLMFVFYLAAVFSHRAYHSYNAVAGIPLAVCGLALVLRDCCKSPAFFLSFCLFCLFFDCTFISDSVKQFKQERYSMVEKYHCYPEICDALKRHDNKILIIAPEAYGYDFFEAKPSCRYFYLSHATPKLENELKQMICEKKVPLVCISGQGDGLYQPYTDCLQKNGYRKNSFQDYTLYESCE